MASFGDDDHFAGRIRVPLPEIFSGTPADWEEWSWNFKAYISTFEPSAVTILDHVEILAAEYTDADLNVFLDTGDIDEDRSARRVLFSRKLHYLLSQLTEDSARLVVRQN